MNFREMESLPHPSTMIDQKELEELKQRIEDKRSKVRNKQEILTLKRQEQELDARYKEMTRGERFVGMDKERLKFWLIVAVVSIFGAIIVWKIILKFI